MARDEGVGRHRQDDARVRPDERAARSAHARGAVRPDDGGVLPRPGGSGRAAVHRQHLPLRAGRLGGLGAARPDALAGRLPADAGVGDGPAAGADHLDPQGLGHVDPGDLRARRRPHRPGAGVGVRPPQRDHDAVAVDRREGHLPGRRPARLDLDDPQGRDPRRGALQRRQRGQGGAAALQGAPGHHRDPRDRRAVRRGQGDGQPRPQARALPVAAVPRRRAVHRHPRHVRPDRRVDPRLQGDPRGQARRGARARVLHEGHDRRGRRGRPRATGRADGAHASSRSRSSPPRARCSTTRSRWSRRAPRSARSACSRNHTPVLGDARADRAAAVPVARPRSCASPSPRATCRSRTTTCCCSSRRCTTPRLLDVGAAARAALRRPSASSRRPATTPSSSAHRPARPARAGRRSSGSPRALQRRRQPTRRTLAAFDA